MFAIAQIVSMWLLLQNGDNPVGVQRFLEDIAEEMQELVNKVRAEAMRLAQQERNETDGGSGNPRTES